MNGIELDAIYRGGHGKQPMTVTIVDFEHVWDGDRKILYAVAVAQRNGVPFSAPARQFEVKDKAYRLP